MSHNAFIRVPDGIWAAIPVLHGELTQMDQTLFKCVNGDDGGTWAPSSLITIGGHGLNVTADFFANGFCNINSNASIGSSPTDALDVFSTSNFHGPSSFVGITATTLSVSGDATLDGFTFAQSIIASGSTTVMDLSCTTLEASGAVACSSTLAVDGTLAVAGLSTLHGVNCTTLIASGNVNAINLLTAAGAALSGPITFTSTGRVVKRVTTSSSTSITTIGPRNCDVLIITSLGSNGSVIIDDTGAQNGDEMRVVNMSSSFLAIVQDPVGPSTILSLKNSTGETPSALFMRVGGTWQWISRDPKNP